MGQINSSGIFGFCTGSGAGLFDEEYASLINQQEVKYCVSINED